MKLSVKIGLSMTRDSQHCTEGASLRCKPSVQAFGASRR
jgi:hypothetical protein